MGQLRPVTIYRLVARHTIEEGIVELHQHKRDLADSLLEGSDTAARLSARDMLDMLAQGLQR
jgi:SNF2 family DNA or RNA helicase